MALTLEEFSDRELLFAFEEHADADGTITSRELADGLGFEPTDSLKHPQQNIAIRLSWLKRYGVVYRDADSGRWGLTQVGYRVLHGGLRARDTKALETLNEDALMAAVELMGRRMLTVNSESATMAQRQWRYSLAQRKRGAR